jgi:hypothetical protein
MVITVAEVSAVDDLLNANGLMWKEERNLAR